MFYNKILLRFLEFFYQQSSQNGMVPGSYEHLIMVGFLQKSLKKLFLQNGYIIDTLISEINNFCKEYWTENVWKITSFCFTFKFLVYFECCPGKHFANFEQVFT